MIISLIPAAAYADDGADVSAALENIVIESTADDNFVLPTDGAGGVSISWTSSDKSAVLPVNGTAYVMSGLGKKTAVLTASAQKGEPQEPSVLEELDINEIIGDQPADALVRGFELPQNVSTGEKITWTSSDTSVLEVEDNRSCKIKPGETSKSAKLTTKVTLWALVESDGIRSIKRFDVNVLQARRGRRFNVFSEGNKGRKI